VTNCQHLQLICLIATRTLRLHKCLSVDCEYCSTKPMYQCALHGDKLITLSLKSDSRTIVDFGFFKFLFLLYTITVAYRPTMLWPGKREEARLLVNLSL